MTFEWHRVATYLLGTTTTTTTNQSVAAPSAPPMGAATAQAEQLQEWTASLMAAEQSRFAKTQYDDLSSMPSQDDSEEATLAVGKQVDCELFRFN